MILCADDYGQNQAISDGILNLIQARKINSVSCLVTSSCWKERAPHLKPFLQNIEIGLHLTLTEPKPVLLPSRSLKALAMSCYLKQLNKKDLIREIGAQMSLFKEAMGKFPDYVDGHEFCHHFPTVREALMEAAEEFQFKKNQIYIRV
ncbi:MAG: ChbG/HpnK family deacetylase, partial [Bdellovibrionales bacterium]|nr:ChbG/HpnK family deacetylase [Bdellovibrionales bacterium]